MSEPTPEIIAAVDEWLADRPEIVRETAAKVPPWNLYRLSDPVESNLGQYVRIVAYAEDGTVRVSVSCEHQTLAFCREVFGIDPDNLKPCDPPSSGTPVGCPEHGFGTVSHG